MERADISSIGFALNSIKNRREIGIVVLLVIWGLSMQEAARHLGVTEPGSTGIKPVDPG
ncbi:hypothetical protein OOK13_44840 [Streptomyces sp. NBC_00378]|uniref:hypothetical protein n=1 Tax=unclassified Streptomyces TaxID=2593676 RepID=UPI00225513CA|nr:MULTISPECIES: hypothetical protein [unclassified Streptomyces]MCX5115430.1 hypothetical protein [Streptomyces sp. NBC_00378]